MLTDQIMWVILHVLLLLLLFVILCGIYLKLKYFTLRGPVPGLSPQFLFGNLIQTGVFSGASLSHIYASLRNKLGDVYQLQLGFIRTIVVGNIDDVQHIFTHRHIYDQGDWFADQIGALTPDSFLIIKGQLDR